MTSPETLKDFHPTPPMDGESRGGKQGCNQLADDAPDSGILVISVAMVNGPIAAFSVELFPTRIRYTSMSLVTTIESSRSARQRE